MSQPTYRRSRRRASARVQGFTLLEMLVALVAGATAITSIYYVSSASARHFHEQQHVAQTQMTLRTAMNQLRADLSRAGYLGTPNSNLEQRCATPPAQVQAVQLTDGAGTSALTLSGANSVEADQLDLVGNYITGDSYLVGTTDATGRRIFLQRGWQGFRRSFSADIAGTFSTDAFTEVFQAGRLLHLRTRGGMNFFPVIQAATAANASVDFSPGLPLQNVSCVQGLADGATVSPLARIRYQVMNVDTAANLATLRKAGSPLAGVNGPALVRLEVNGAGAPIAGTERIIAEHVAEFDVDFVVDQSLTAGAAPNLQLLDNVNAQNALAPTARPHSARSAVVRLSIRTAAEDPRFPFAARAGGGPLLSYQLSTAEPGAARVRTMTSEILLPNLAYAGML